MGAIEEANAPVDGVRVKGMFRVQLEENGEIVGDSGWHENLITNYGFANAICALIGHTTGSIQVSHLALGSGGVPVATDTTLAGEVVKRQAVTVAVNSSKTVQFTGTFSSSNSFVTNSQNISNIGLFGTSSTGSLIAGNTFASSTCATNQNVNTSYQISFS